MMNRVMGILLGASLVFSLSGRGTDGALKKACKNMQTPAARHALACTYKIAIKENTPLGSLGLTMLGLWGISKAEKDWDIFFSVTELGLGVVSFVRFLVALCQ